MIWHEFTKYGPAGRLNGTGEGSPAFALHNISSCRAQSTQVQDVYLRDDGKVYGRMCLGFQRRKPGWICAFAFRLRDGPIGRSEEKEGLQMEVWESGRSES